MKKSLPLFLALGSSVFATSNPYCPPEPPAKCYTPSPCQCRFCLGPPNPTANAPVRPFTCDGDIAITVAGLYWKADADGLEYAIDDQTIIESRDNLIDARYLTPNFKWNGGFKLGIGYNSPCDGWDVSLLWTRYEGRASSHVVAEEDDITHTLIAIWSAFKGGVSGIPFATDIKSHWTCALDLVDLDLGREYWVSRYLSLRPHVGLRFANIDQSYSLEHKGGSWDGNDFFQIPDFNDTVRIDNTFWGVGPKAGFDLDFRFGCGWSLYSQLAASILYGRFDVDHDEWVRAAEAPFTRTRILETEDHFRSSRSVLDLGLGIKWASLICDCKYGLAASLGFEQHLFFHQNQMWRVKRWDPQNFIDFPNNTGENIHSQRRGNVSTQGWTLKLEFDF